MGITTLNNVMTCKKILNSQRVFFFGGRGVSQEDMKTFLNILKRMILIIKSVLDINWQFKLIHRNQWIFASKSNC